MWVLWPKKFVSAVLWPTRASGVFGLGEVLGMVFDRFAQEVDLLADGGTVCSFRFCLDGCEELFAVFQRVLDEAVFDLLWELRLPFLGIVLVHRLAEELRLLHELLPS